MKQKLTIFPVTLALLAFLFIPMWTWGQSDYSTDYTGNVTLSTDGGSNASECQIIISDNSYNGIKAGTSTKAGAVMVTVPSGTKYLHLHVAAWNNTNVSLVVTPEDYSDNIALTANTGIANSSPFTFNGDPSTEDYYKVITFESPLTTDTDLTFTASGGKRFVIWGVTTEEAGGTLPNPSITAANVELAYNATSGAIEYTVNNPITGGMVNASTTSDWITLGSLGETIPFTCTANTLSSNRTASVTLTYTYNTDQMVSKNVTVTQNGNPNVLNDISDITADGTYTVQGTIVAKSQRGFIVGDGTGYVYYYNQNYAQADYNIGDMVTLSGSVVTFGGVFEFNNSTVITTATSSNYVAENPTIITGADMDARVTSTTPQLSNYVQYVGTLTVSGNYYNITSIDGATTAKGSISFPLDTDFASLADRQVIVKGYYVGISSNQYYNTMLGSIEENVVSDAELSTSVTQLSGFQYVIGAGPSQNQNFTITGSDLSDNVTVTAPQDFEIALTSGGTYANSFDIAPNAGSVSQTVYVRMKAGLSSGNYTGNISVTCGELSKSVALSGTVNEQSIAEAPTFSPLGGTYFSAQNVTLSTTTAGATIYYTLDESDPTTASAVYSTPIAVNTTTTIKAIAVAEGFQNSPVAEAIYTINEPMTIAQARALEDNAYAYVEGIVIFIDGRNVYIQDETAGIDLYLNNNTVPASLAIGDKVRAYGKKTVYNHLVELTAINGNNTDEFSIISTDNTLPEPAIQTIAEINGDFDGENMIQSTRVKIEEAIIGAINTNGTTVITQDGNSLNIYRIPAVTGMLQGDLVTVTGVVCCHNGNLQLRVVSADDILFEHRPVLTATPTTLSGFTYDIEDGGPSGIQHFNLSGDNLHGAARVYPSESFEVSTLGEDLFHSEDPAPVYNPGSFFDIKIYVRMKASLEIGTYNEQLYAVSEDADTLYISVSGTVTGEIPTPPDPPAPGDGNYVRISELSGLADGDYVIMTARFDSNVNDYYAMTNASSGKPTGVLFTSATANENEVLPASIVNEENSYYWVVGVTENGYTFTNANGELIGYGESGTDFITGGEKIEWNITMETAGGNAMVPEYTGFYITNATTTNRGFALNNQHNFGAYAVSNNNGNAYNFYLDLFVKTEGSTPPTPTVATPTFTPVAGTYDEAQTVSIVCSTEGAIIHYTLDATIPTESSPVYSAPLIIEETTTVKAIAMKEGYNNSNVAEATYTIQTGSGSATIFDQDWEDGWHGWTQVSVAGDSTWRISQYSGNHFAYMNAYNDAANEDWLISPAFNVDEINNPILTFRSARKYNGPDIEVYFSSDYNGSTPATATWQPLTCTLSTGNNWIWAESGNINLSGFSGTNCYIAFKYTSTDSQAPGWEIDDITLVGLTSDPIVTVTPMSLTGFSYIEGNGPSAEQSFTVSGFNLNHNVTITKATDYEISLTSGAEFVAQNTLTLTVSSGNLEETTVYVRLKAGLAVGAYDDEDITIACADVDDIDVSCSGTVNSQPVSSGNYVRISDAGTLVDGNKVILAARYNGTANAYLAVANTLTSGKLTTTEFTSTMNGTEEIIPDNIISNEDNHYWTVGVTADGYTFTNADGNMIGYGSSGTNLVMNGEKTAWNIATGVSAPESLVPEYYGFNIVNVTTDNRAMALRVTETDAVVKAYATSNMTDGEYNFFLDIFMQGEGGVPPTPTVATPTFTPGAGTYYETQDVVISCTTTDATIYYSLDSESGPWEEYEEAVTVDESMTIWAYATKEGYNNSPVVSAEYIIQNDLVIIFNQDWEEDWHGWTQQSMAGDSTWRINQHNGNHYAYINAYQDVANEDWLISPAFNLDSYNDVVLTFRTARNYTGPDIEVYFSDDYDGADPSAATWQEIECPLSTGSWNWVESGQISLNEFSGSNCYIAFKYISTEDQAAGWEVDDIMLVSGGAVTIPTLTATPNTISGLEYIEGEGPSNSQSYTLTGANLVGEGNVIVTASENFEISIDNEYFTEELTLMFADGEIVNQPATIYVRLVEGLEVGSYMGSISHQGGEASTEVSLTGVVRSENEPMIEAFMPLYIQGNNGSNNNRVPVAIAVYLENLEPSTTYRYTNQFVDNNDGPETAGAGNVIYVSEEGFYRSTSPSLSTEGGYGEFTTDEDGFAFTWFMNEPTANARFTPGNQVYLRIRLNDGHDGTTVEHIFTTPEYATVLNFGTEYEEYSGTAFYAKSNEAPMSFAMLYATEDDERPVYSTSIETIGVDFGSINQYADFYKDEVAGNDGWFGGILPNDNKPGINSIRIVDMGSDIINEYNTQYGEWQPEANTINPNAGLDNPIFIDLTDDGVDEAVVANVKVWNTDHEFVIENGDNAHYMMTVYNILGQPMMRRQINAGSTEHISHSLAAGVYIINLQNNQSNVSVKVIVR